MDKFSEIAGAATRALANNVDTAGLMLGEGVLAKPVLRISPDLAAALVVGGEAITGVARQAVSTDETPGVVTVGELLQEFGAAVRRYGK